MASAIKFKTIVADPPWPMPETGKITKGPSQSLGVYESKGGKITNGEWWGRRIGKTVKLQYDTMTIDQIKSLPIPAEENAHLYLWTTARFILNGAAMEVAKEWGFRPAQLLTWCKPPLGMGFGGAFCNTTEFIIFCRRGILKHHQREDSTWWKWSRPYENGHIAHSAKPEAFQDMVMQVSPGPYLELFARRTRLGWSTWGNESLCHVELMTPNGT
jgi:N6-adenosine-specific RNA methylase IME4